VPVQVDALEQIGLKGAQIEHVCTIAWGILNRKPEQLLAVADFVKTCGVSNVSNVLFHNPKLLEYDPDGDEMKKGHRARARIMVKREGGNEKLLVSFYSANASFTGSPIAPWSPVA
jgi:hypothetical protein